MTSIQSLPPLPSSLKPVSPYVQRASELKAQDPVMAYWCTYYAAQIGLDVKSQEPGAREYLFSLITLLETVRDYMKSEVGDNDAVENEDAAAAYIENFGIKVFTMADNEDRRNAATRSTAKKFLAAANFLELLEIFPKSNGVENNQEKIRYAKWKAADISKALREGRRPTPGPANAQVEESSPASSSTTLQEPTAGPSKQAPTNDLSTPIHSHPSTHTQTTAAPQINIKAPQTPPRTYEHLPPGFVPTHSGLPSPGSWSTAATPGKDDRYQADVDTRDFASAAQGYGALNNLQDVPPPAKPRRKATVSEEFEDEDGSISRDNPKAPAVAPLPRQHVVQSPPTPTKKVHFTPSVVGGSSTSGSPPHSPVERVPPKPAEPVPQTGPVPMPLTYRPSEDSTASPHTIIRVSPPKGPGAFAELDRRAGTSSQPQPIPTPTAARSSPPTRSSPPSRNSPPSHNVNSPHTPGQPDQRPHGQAGPAARPIPAPVPPPPAPPARPAASGSSPPAGLTMAQIAKAQKHCRFAISALEYEDAEQARKELRAALKVLGD